MEFVEMLYRPDSVAFLTDSIEELQGLKGCRIAAATRYFEYDIDKFLADFSQVREDELFSLGCGPLFLSFDNGSVIGLGDSPRDVSVVMWKGAFNNAQAGLNSVDGIESYHEIDCLDGRYSNEYWAQLIGARVKELAIVKARDAGVVRDYRNERGLLVTLDTGHQWIASIKLRESGPGHFVLMSPSDTRKDIEQSVEFIAV